MTNLMIPDMIADKLFALAKRERRSLEEVLASMLEKYTSEDEITARLKAMGGLIPPSDQITEPPMTEEELQQLAARIGAAGSLSSLIIEERKQGY